MPVIVVVLHLALDGGTLVPIALGHYLALLYKNTILAINLETKNLTDEIVESNVYSDQSR